MPEMTFADLQAALRTNIASAVPGLDAPAQAAMAAAMAAEVVRLATPGRSTERRLDADLLRPGVVYAVPDETLNLIPTLVQAAIGVFTKGPVGALSDVVALMFRYRGLRVELGAEEAAVLKVLKAAATLGQPPLSLADLGERLRSEQLLPARRLPEVMAALQAKKTDKTTLVKEAGGRWSIGNV
jgi:hypothetical protein